MNDVDMQVVFTRLLETEPHTPDIVPYVDKARHDTRRRRWAVAGGGVVTCAILVVAALVVPSVLINSLSDQAPSRPVPGSSTTASADSQQAHAARLTKTLQESQAQWLPNGATLKNSVADWPWGSRARPDDGSYPLTFGFRLTKSAFKHTSPLSTDTEALEKERKAPFDGATYTAGGLVTGSGSVSRLIVMVEAVDSEVSSCRGRAGTCVESKTADGDTLIVQGEPGGESEWKMRTVMLIRQDGSMITVSEYTAQAGPPGVPSNGEFAMTLDQLKEIALLPGLVYKYQS